MTAVPDWIEIARRLALTAGAGVLMGANRTARGRPAGLRTTCLVALAAAVAMIQADLLLATSGKGPNSFAVMDVERLPLGILSGIGFIGAGTILKHGHLVTGITTAATLWFISVVGLCFGGGQIGLGVSATAMGLATLWCMEWVEVRMRQERIGELKLLVRKEPALRGDLDRNLSALGFRIISWSSGAEAEVWLSCEIRWQTRHEEVGVPDFVRQISQRPDIMKYQWREVMRKSR
ncbi:MAG TPA: MgtC/SapB family protein [Bryobacteraceae bacterium]|nr:MgtC/SapB family protein [Bryobacteraceae bacterium]